jgi:hypothetical protein
MQCPGPGPGRRSQPKPPYPEMSRISILQWFYLSCYIYSIWFVIGSPKYSPLFLGKGRTLLKYSIAQKTPKNICLNLFEKGNRKLFFIKKLRRKSSPKFSIKLWGKLSALCFLTLCVIPTIRFVLDSPKYFPFFFGKGRTLSKYSIA